jgi:hypothetical protein
MNPYFTSIDTFLRKKYKLPAEWRGFRWAVLDPLEASPGLHVTGAVAPPKTRGRWKGEPNWRRMDKSTVQSFCVMNATLSRIERAINKDPTHDRR